MDKRYPDLALLAQPARRAICCLAVEGGGEKMEGLLNRKPFSRYAENGLTVLLYDEAQSEAWRAEIERILAESGLCAGLSGPFALAASARGCFPKARIALETGRAVDPGRALYDMGTYSEAALLRAARTALGAQGFRASDFGDAAIEALARLDEREDAQYIRSLRAYLSDGLNLRRAAERLGVHRNTLAYRMRRIEARFALDLSDMNTCFELLFSLWLKEGLGGRADDEPTAAFDRDAARAALWRSAERAGNAARTEERFPLALAAVAAGGLSDARRAELTLALSALPQKPVTAFDDFSRFRRRRSARSRRRRGRFARRRARAWPFRRRSCWTGCRRRFGSAGSRCWRRARRRYSCGKSARRCSLRRWSGGCRSRRICAKTSFA